MPARPDKRPLDLALDLLVYAPVGLVLSAQETLPRLAERGRQRVTGRIATARVVGQFTVRQGQAQAAKVFNRSSSAPAPAPDLDGGVTPPEPAPAPTRAVRPKSPRQAPRPVVPVTAGDDLAIPGYDSLSASQVLPRLEGLAVAELEAVRAYETAHRGRRTILGRVAQLQSSS